MMIRIRGWMHKRIRNKEKLKKSGIRVGIEPRTFSGSLTIWGSRLWKLETARSEASYSFEISTILHSSAIKESGGSDGKTACNSWLTCINIWQKIYYGK